MRAHNRVEALLQEAAQRVQECTQRKDQRTLLDAVTWNVKANHGLDLRMAGSTSIPPLDRQLGWRKGEDRKILLLEVSRHLALLEKQGMSWNMGYTGPKMTASSFERRLNEILATNPDEPLRLQGGVWTTTGESEADRLLVALLNDRDDIVAGCKQGDVQQEMVASAVQSRLRDGTTIVDYGAGLGRVGEGLSTASLFASSGYIAVDSPINPELEKLLSKLGSQAHALEREEFLQSETQAGVILMVNTLHHVPFDDLGRQFAALLNKLPPNGGGELIVHEMGELPAPEKRRVAWHHDDVVRLLTLEDLHVNPRHTETSGKKIPLAHVIVTRQRKFRPDLQGRLEANARAVWQQMKDRVVGQLDQLLERADESELPALRRALITNANLDLNRPKAAPESSVRSRASRSKRTAGGADG